MGGTAGLVVSSEVDLRGADGRVDSVCRGWRVGLAGGAGEAASCPCMLAIDFCSTVRVSFTSLSSVERVVGLGVGVWGRR